MEINRKRLKYNCVIKIRVNRVGGSSFFNDSSVRLIFLNMLEFAKKKINIVGLIVYSLIGHQVGSRSWSSNLYIFFGG